MSDAVFRVVRAGPHVSVQDAGRRGLMRFGVPSSGPMDRASFAIANVALGNGRDAPGIEVSLGGVSLVCLAGAVTVAVAGGGFIVNLDDAAHGSWRILTVRAGQSLTIRPGPWGSWTYLAFAGRLAARAWLGSAATHSQSGFGGGKLAAGMEFTVTAAEVRDDLQGGIACPVTSRPRQEVRVVLGPQDRFFSAAAIDALLNSRFRLSDSYDRMGVRLAGPPLAPERALAIPSEAIVRGSIQVSGDGVATVLLADHQTTGGYPKIATVISDDLDSFVQLRPRAGVCFRQVSHAEAIALARRRALAKENYLASLAGAG